MIKPTLVICMRVSGSIPPPAEVRAEEGNCSRCQEKIWVAKSTRDSIPPEVPLICSECATPAIAREMVAMIQRGHFEEVARRQRQAERARWN